MGTIAKPTKTIEVPLWSYEDASDDVKKKIMQKHYDINVDGDFWFESIYEDAKIIGLEITDFDTYHGTIHGKLKNYVDECCALILTNHGKKTDTYALAKKFKGTDSEDEDYEEIEKEFSYSLLEEYLSMLRKEYEYMTGEEAIVETFAANEYLFDEEGAIRG